MAPATRSAFLRDAVAATAVLAALYLLARVALVPPLQVSGYLLVVGFDALEAAFGSAGRYYDVLFAAYVLALGLVGAGVAHLARRLPAFAESDLPAWRLGLAGGLVVVAALAFAFAGLVFAGSGLGDPVYVTAGTGVVLLVCATLLGDASGVTDRLRTLAR